MFTGAGVVEFEEALVQMTIDDALRPLALEIDSTGQRATRSIRTLRPLDQ